MVSTDNPASANSSANSRGFLMTGVPCGKCLSEFRMVSKAKVIDIDEVCMYHIHIYIHMYEIHHGIQLYPIDIYHIIVYFQVTRKISLKLWSLEFRQNSAQTSLGFSTKGSTSAELWRVGLFQVARIHRDTLGKTYKTVGPQKIEDTRC